MEREHFYTAVRGYLQKAHPDVSPDLMERVGEDDNLWDLGYLDSFGMVRLLTFLEQLLGRALVLSTDSLRTFHTLRRMYDSHAADPSASVSA